MTFDEGRMAEVLPLVDSFRRDFPHSKRESSVTFIAAQAALRLRQLDRARIEAHKLRLKFPNSGFADDARMIQAECSLMSERWVEAREHLNWVLGFSQDEELVNTARSYLDELNRFEDLQARVLAGAGRNPSAEPKIGLILPLSAPEGDAARAFLHGFKVVWDSTAPGDLIVYDSQGDPIRAVRLVQLLVDQDGVWGIVGGLEPAEAAGLAAAAEAYAVPFLTTTCRIDNLASIGRYVFQGRPDYCKIGAALGQYATQELGLLQFGILAPVSQMGRQLVGGFKEAVNSMGGEILAEEAYYPGTDDLSSQLKRIRKTGLRRAYDDSLRNYFATRGYLLIDNRKFKVPESALQSALPLEGIIDETIEDTVRTITDGLLDSLWKADHVRLQEWMTQTKQEIDSLEIPLKVYDGFLFLIEPGAIEIAAPQFARFNIATQLLGNENWADRDALYRVRNYVDGLIFCEPMAVRGGEDFGMFAVAVAGMDSTDVNVHHLEGERAARMMLFAATKAEERETMRVALSQIRDLETLSGKVSLLKEERVDHHVTLVRYKSGECEVIDE